MYVSYDFKNLDNLKNDKDLLILPSLPNYKLFIESNRRKKNKMLYI